MLIVLKHYIILYAKLDYNVTLDYTTMWSTMFFFQTTVSTCLLPVPCYIMLRCIVFPPMIFYVSCHTKPCLMFGYVQMHAYLCL